MSTRKSMPGLSDSNIYTAPNEFPNKAPTTTKGADDLCPPGQRNRCSGETDTFVAVHRLIRADRGTRSASANCEAP
jgi:hypothetical protein